MPQGRTAHVETRARCHHCPWCEGTTCRIVLVHTEWIGHPADAALLSVHWHLCATGCDTRPQFSGRGQ